MKRNMAAWKRLCLIVLALLLVQTAAISALASEAGVPACSITITNQDDMPDMTEGQFTAYQIFGGRLMANAPEGEERRISDITWGSGIDAGGFMEELLADETLLEAEGEETAPETVGELFVRGLSAGDLAVGDSAEYTEDAYAAQTARVLSDSPYRDDGDLLEQFARIAAGHLTENGTDSVLTDSGLPGGRRESVITVDGPGYYLVTENSGAEEFVRENNAVSQYILEVLGSQTVERKADIPEVTKEILSGDEPVKGVSAGVTDTMWFRITGTLPRNYDAYDTFFYQLTDTITRGFTFVGTSLKLTIDGQEVAPYKKETGEFRFRFPITHNADGSGDTFQIIFEDLNKLKEEGYVITADSRIVVTYCARVNGKARLVPGEDNRVTLEYSNDPNDPDGDSTGYTTEKAVYMYPLGLDIAKIGSDEEHNAGLNGAVFLLSRQAAPDGDGGSETWYGVFGDRDQDTGRQKLVRWVEDPGQASQLVTDETGHILVEGLGAGAYTLTETRAPDGYNAMKPVSFSMTADIDENGLLTALTMSVDGTRDDVAGQQDAAAEDGTIAGNVETGLFAVTLIDQKSSILPHTGGRGAEISFLAGALFLAGGMVCAGIWRKRKTAVSADVPGGMGQ